MHAVIVERGSLLASCVFPDGENCADFDTIDAFGRLLRACRAADNIAHPGEPYSPPDFAAMNLQTPLEFDALRGVVAEWLNWCEVHTEDIPDYEKHEESGVAREFSEYWTRREKDAAERVLILIDVEAVQ